MGNKRRSSDPNDTIRLLKSKLRSLERENQRLRKTGGRFKEETGNDDDNDNDSEEIEQEKHKKMQRVTQTNPTCEKCGSSDTTTMELSIRGENRFYVTCRSCKSRKRTTKR